VVAAGLGAVLGLAFLSKYAAVYFLAAILLHAGLSRSARRAWSLPAAGAALTALALILAPNVVWNATHDFSTLSHTAEETNWNDPDLFNPLEMAEFVGEQLGVFGPIPFLLLLGAGTVLAARRRLREEDVALLLFSAPPLLVVSIQAFISGANANWAAAAYVPGSVLVAAWMVRWRSRGLMGATVAIQGLLGAVFLAGVIHGGLADRLGFGNGFKRARGWEATAELVAREVEATPGFTAVATDNRFLFNALAYYGRDAFARSGAPPLTIWMRKTSPQNQAETTAPLTVDRGRRVLVASIVPDYRPMIERDFSAWRLLRRAEVRLDPRRTREVALYEASGYRPAPRDRVSGLPTGS
jgi:4-amino-4-deoxy-L-arabinose transferase-like glycosyltransferase